MFNLLHKKFLLIAAIISSSGCIWAMEPLPVRDEADKCSGESPKHMRRKSDPGIGMVHQKGHERRTSDPVTLEGNVDMASLLAELRASQADTGSEAAFGDADLDGYIYDEEMRPKKLSCPYPTKKHFVSFGNFMGGMLKKALGTTINTAGRVTSWTFGKFAEGTGAQAKFEEFGRTIKSESVATLKSASKEVREDVAALMAVAKKDVEHVLGATKEDVTEVMGVVKKDFVEVTEKVKNDFAEVAAETKRDVTDLTAGIRKDLGDSIKEISVALDTLKGTVKQVEGVMKGANEVVGGTTGVVDKFNSILDSQPKKLIAYGIIGALGIAATYYTVRLLYNHWERALAKPKLVIYTTLNQGPWARLKGYFKTPRVPKKLVFSPEISKSLNNVIATTKSIHEKITAAEAKRKVSNVKYRNVLLWGKPGGGKTAFAQELADQCGMDVVILSGAAFAQYKEGEGITEMNTLFDDIYSSPNGVLVFMDEADSFAGGRNDHGATAKTSYQLVNNWLHHTGGRSSKVMFVYATNRKDAFDNAFARRIDDYIEITLPGIEEREQILRLYRDTLMLDPEHNSTEFMVSVRQTLTDAFLFEAALATDGLSGAELEGIINSMISDASVADYGLLTRAIADEVVKLAVKKSRELGADLEKPQDGVRS